MIAKPLQLVCVGKLKTPCWIEACKTYEKRLSRFRRLKVTEVRDATASPEKDRPEVEGKRLLEACSPRDMLVVLDERGKDLTSVQLAELLDRGDAECQGCMTFLVGGPFGHAPMLRERAHLLLRLSALTLPHELARVVLMEQLYRAECLRAHVPYHH